MTGEVKTLVLDLDLGSTPLSGVVREGEGEPTPFAGWLELMSVLETAAEQREGPEESDGAE